MASLEDFLNTKEEEEIVTAIRQAEQKTSGEIRVHMKMAVRKHIETRAKEVFQLLKMDRTKLPKWRSHLCRRFETSVWNLWR